MQEGHTDTIPGKEKEPPTHTLRAQSSNYIGTPLELERIKIAARRSTSNGNTTICKKGAKKYEFHRGIDLSAAQTKAKASQNQHEQPGHPPKKLRFRAI